MNQDIYTKITDALVQDGYIILTNALDAHLPKSLKQFAQNEIDFKPAGISGKDDVHLDTTKRRDKTHWLKGDDGVQSEFLNFTEGLREHLNHELYLGLTYYESHFAIYDEGDFYERHLDNFKGFKNRVVTTVYYLNDAWHEDDGGELIVYDAEESFLAKIKPEGNTLIVFMSERFPHEVLPAKKQRFSIAGWFRIDKHS